ncbi:NAD(P)/FAD-dependent oxidoreductase [Aureimonas jatrophae]|uniref:Gamma-glutamylputrescine oxidase n=1 Tax=Aureimonas jatrophae TaxID=1166073 RepID=A0A1H0L2F5_9HYPH|nr:FAD-binding oxidoreductase [Aureimonas jatrophae]MBB3952384.1 gamma-glutamylputrescine oxidase [Aureimonas jatrophae]SDO62417.1 gamma-glutamylputrescine oxidase [Aureimonas jatrophae]
MDAAPYQSPISPGRSWYEDSVPDRPRYPALDGSLEADVAVVGGGFTGLSAALHLAERGARVCVLEAARFGDGASGRNGGQLGTGHRLWPEELEAAFGLERARALFALAEDAKSHLMDLMATHAIEADYRPGQISLAHRRRFHEPFRRHADMMRERFGYTSIRFLEAEDTFERTGSRTYRASLLDTGTGHIHPMKLLVGTARAAARAGALLFEGTPARRIGRRDGRVEIETARGTVRADRLLLATNAHGGRLERRNAAHVMPIRSFIAATAPLAEPHRVLPGDEAADDSRFVVRYFRKSADHRLLFGGREAYGSSTGDIAGAIRRQIADVYPHLADVAITHAWGGSVAVTTTRMPYVDTPEPGITAIGGYSGHGVMLSHFSGRLYAERVLGNRDRLAELESLRVPAFPGGDRLRAPLLFLAMTWFALRDRL